MKLVTTYVLAPVRLCSTEEKLETQRSYNVHDFFSKNVEMYRSHHHLFRRSSSSFYLLTSV